MQFEETDYSYEKFNTGIWRKVLKVVLKRKRYVVLMIFFVLFLVALDIMYPLLNEFAVDTFFGDDPDFSKKYLYIGGFLLIIVGYLVSIAGFIDVPDMSRPRSNTSCAGKPSGNPGTALRLL